MNLYFKFLNMHLKCQMQYKTSFFIIMLSQFINTFFNFLGLQFILSNFYDLNGFKCSEVILCFAIVLFAFSISEFISKGFDIFPNTISNGEFDRILIKPRNTIFLVFASKLDFSKIGSIIQSSIILIYAILKIDLNWNLNKFTLLFSMILSGIVIFTSLFIVYATLCFFTLEGLDIVDMFTHGGAEFGRYPLSLYGSIILKFFTCVIPLALFQYYPLLYLIEKDQHMINFISPYIGILFCVPILLFWKFGIKRYKSIGA